MAFRGLKLTWMFLKSLYIVLFFRLKTVAAVNLAAGKFATQSSRHRVYTDADKAVDGKADKVFSHLSCTHTHCHDRAPWWMVDLEKVYVIMSVTISNPDIAGVRARNFRIELYKTHPKQRSKPVLCATQGSQPIPVKTDKTFTCTKPTRAQYVRISKTIETNCDALILCEVVVHGEEIVVCPNNFVMHEETCYFYSDHKAGNWFQARDMCRAMGADLAIADNKEKVKFFKSGLKSLGALTGRIYYLGGHAFNGGTAFFYWLNPNALSIGVFNDWDKATNPKNPEPDKDDELCFGMHRDHYFTWHNIHCSRREHYICEKNNHWPLK